jgi:ABC-2 type transport system permease protein
MTSLTGTAPLVRFALRRDRIFLPVWVLAVVGLVHASADAVRAAYDTPAKVEAYAATMSSSPASIAMSGPPDALDTLAGILIFETGATALIGTALMAVFLVVRHTRAEEEAGRTELLRSTVVGPGAPIASTLLVAWGASLLVGLGIAASLTGPSVPGPRALAYGASVTALGLVFSAAAVCAAQLTSHARGAVGMCLAVLAAAFVLRAVGDVGNSVWSWLSPVGWSQQVLPASDSRWWPLAMSVALSAALVTCAAVLSSGRDLGSGVLPQRPGPASAGADLGGPFGLAWRLQRGLVLSWAAGVLVLGLMFGSLSREVERMATDNPTLADYLAAQGAASLVDSFFATALVLLANGAAAFAVTSALRTRAEETAGRLEPLLATPLSRVRWLVAALGVTVLGSAVVVASGGLGVGVAHALVTGDGSEAARMTGSAAVYLPAVLVLAALAAVLVGWAPRAVGLAWLALAGCFVASWLGGLLTIPSWLERLSPFTSTPSAPAESVTTQPLVVLVAVGVAGLAAGIVGFARRDLD